MVLFGTALPILIAWFSAKWLASRLKHWWGNIISVVISFLLGVILSLAMYAAYDTFIIGAGPDAFLLRLIGNSIWMSAAGSIWSVVRTKRAVARLLVKPDVT